MLPYTSYAAWLTLAERRLINRLVAFFATGDSIVSNNLVLNLYKHIHSPEARMYLSRPRLAWRGPARTRPF
jgi:ribonucleotide reductase beta subunit family protein with ferritin-like domain